MSGTWITKSRGIRVPDHRWNTFAAITQVKGETMASVVNRAIEEYNMRNAHLLQENPEVKS